MKEHVDKVRAWAESQAGCPYVYGATGALCTPAYRRQRASQYPDYGKAITDNCPVLSGRQNLCGGCRHAGRPCYDCAQLTRAAMKLCGIALPSGASSQWKSGNWAWKGPLTPEAGRSLCLVFRESGDRERPMRHVGLSLGDGRVLDARGHGEGVLLRPIGSYPWTHFALPAALYPQRVPPLQPGDRGPEVQRLQLLLIQRGHALPKHGADGIFGAETLEALQAFLRKQGLEPGDSADQDLLSRLEKLPQLEKDLETRVRALEIEVDALKEAMA